MTITNPLTRRQAATFLFVTFLLLSAAIFQDFRSSAQKQELFSDAANEKVSAAPVLTIAPITWGVLGLDSNNVTVGPNVFPVGARVCNTGSTVATNVSSAFVWDTANALIDLRAGSNASLTKASLAAGACTDMYYEVALTRSSAAYDTTRRYHITATADTLGTVSTPTPREVYVEKLVSQNRNSVTGIKLNGVNVPFGGSMNLTVGNTYNIELDGSTATNGYEQIKSFINLPNVIFQTLNVATSYSAPSGFAGTKLYEDACGWVSDPMNVNYRSCAGTGKAGGTVAVTYTVKILSGGGTTQTLNTLIYDFSGSSYHYNSDFSTSSVIANILNPPSSANVSVSGRVLTSGGRGISNVRVVLFEANGNFRSVFTGRFGFFKFDEVEDGQTVIVGVQSRRFSFSEPAQVLSLTDNVVDLNFVADQ